ncbi:hypothetical protein [Pseudoalteromonas phage KB12-38]|nr:hypothetical protein [Pseudoalteromonas phage KB12-38]
MNEEQVRFCFDKGYLLTHKPTGKIYRPIGIGKQKVNGQWQESLSYRPFNSIGLFTRPVNDFANFSISA